MATVDTRSQDTSSGHSPLGCQPLLSKDRGTVYDGSAHSQPAYPEQTSLCEESDLHRPSGDIQPAPEEPNRAQSNFRHWSASDHRADDVPEKAGMFLDVLSQAGSSELRRVQVEIADGKVVLIGRVSSYYHKQIAQECVRPMAIGMEIDNKIKVVS